MPGERHSVHSQSGAEPRHTHWPIVAVARRFLPAPGDLDGASIQLLGNRDGLTHVVLVSTPSESAAQETVVQINMLHRNACYFRCIDRGILGILRRHPNI